MAREDLTGQKFNHWTVIKLDEERSGKRSYWICQCDCEDKTIKSVRSDQLKNGHSKSCGCYNRAAAAIRMREIGKINNVIKQDLTGQDFGYWHVDSRAENKNKHVAWNCTCKCGTKRVVLGQSLKNGQSQSCGCMNMSHGEYAIQQLLLKNNIPFQREYVEKNINFGTLGKCARFDFYVDNKYMIEFDGEQHTLDKSDSNFFKHGLDEIKEHDQIKNQWCKNNNIPLIRIPYTHLDKICLEDLQLETSNFII